MKNICEFPDQELLNNLYKIFYKEGIKPLSIDFDVQNKKINLMYTHNDFIDVFGEDFDMDEIYILSPNAYRLRRQFSDDNGLILTVLINLSEQEVNNHKLIKIWGCGNFACV